MKNSENPISKVEPTRYRIMPCYLRAQSAMQFDPDAVRFFVSNDPCVGCCSWWQVHLVENVRQRDEKYWLPGQPEDAFVCVRVCMYE